MSIVEILPEIIEDSKKAYEKLLAENEFEHFRLKETAGWKNQEKAPENKLFYGDNLDVIMFLQKNCSLQEKIDLIYIDPPFLTGTNYGTSIKINTGVPQLVPTVRQKAYNDNFERGLEGYLRMITIRLFAMKDLLAPNASIFVHLDWHAVHYVKVIMDEIFGEKNFVNEIIWHYKSGGASTRRFARKHDNILFYSKGPKYYFKAEKEKSYNRDFKPYRFKGVKEYRDKKGWYTMVNRKDVWELDMVGRTSAERTGYVTQKPESLIERILLSCTEEGDLCADFFGGSGTMAAAAEKMARKWISCDIGKPATISSMKRLVGESAYFSFYEKENKEEKLAGEIKVDVTFEKEALLEKYKLKIDLKEYKIKNLDLLPIDKEHLPLIKKGFKEDSLQFIAYWSVDSAYNGKNPRPDRYMTRSDVGLVTEYENIVSKIGQVYVSGMDIFGNRFEFLWKEA